MPIPTERLRPSSGSGDLSGVLSPQGFVEHDGRRARLDAMLPTVGLRLIGLGDDPKAALRPSDLEFLESIGTSVVRIADADQPGEGGLIDVSGAYGALLCEHGVTALLVRPDLYVFGGVAEPDELPDLVAEPRRSLDARV